MVIVNPGVFDNARKSPALARVGDFAFQRISCRAILVTRSRSLHALSDHRRHPSRVLPSVASLARLKPLTATGSDQAGSYEIDSRAAIRPCEHRTRDPYSSTNLAGESPMRRLRRHADRAGDVGPDCAGTTRRGDLIDEAPAGELLSLSRTSDPGERVAGSAGLAGPGGR